MKRGSKLSIVAFVLSVIFFIPFLPAVGMILGIVALVKGRKFENSPKKLAIAAILIGGILGVLIPFWLFFSVVNDYEENFEIYTLSSSSLAPMQVLQISGEFDTDADTYVRFLDDSGFLVESIALEVYEDTVYVGVPLYFDSQTFDLRSGFVDVVVVQDGKASNSLSLGIENLPEYSDPPGTITVSYIEGVIAQIEDTKSHVIQLEELSGGTLSASDLNNDLNTLQTAYQNLKDEIEIVMANPGTAKEFSESNGEVFLYDEETLEFSDRVLGSMSSYFIGGNLVTPLAENPSFSDRCKKLEGLELQTIYACFRKRFAGTGAVLTTADYANKATYNNQQLAKRLSLIGKLRFVGLTLLPSVFTYSEDLDALVAETGKSANEIKGPLRRHYVNKVGLAYLDLVSGGVLGTSIGVMGDLILGPEDVIIKGIRPTAWNTRHLARQAAHDEGRLPEDSGLDLIICDLCEETPANVHRDPDGYLVPDEGYEWVNPSDPEDFRVKIKGEEDPDSGVVDEPSGDDPVASQDGSGVSCPTVSGFSPGDAYDPNLQNAESRVDARLIGPWGSEYQLFCNYYREFGTDFDGNPEYESAILIAEFQVDGSFESRPEWAKESYCQGLDNPRGAYTDIFSSTHVVKVTYTTITGYESDISSELRVAAEALLSQIESGFAISC